MSFKATTMTEAKETETFVKNIFMIHETCESIIIGFDTLNTFPKVQ